MFNRAATELKDKRRDLDNDHYQIVSVRDPKLVALLETLAELKQGSVTSLFTEKFSEELADFIMMSKDHIPIVEKALRNKVGRIDEWQYRGAMGRLICKGAIGYEEPDFG